MFRRRKRPVDDFASEVRAHLEQEAEDLRAEGRTRAEARAIAQRRFGNVTAAVERFYEKGRWIWLDHLFQDLRYSLRAMRQAPGFTCAAVLTLALGMGANTAIFSLMDAVLLRSLPVAEPDRLYFLRYAGAKGIGISPPYPCFESFRSQATTLAGVAAYGGGDFTITVDGRPEQVPGRRISGDYFGVLRLNAAAGRLLTPADEQLNPPAAVISYEYWQRRFGGSPEAIGKTFIMAVGSDKATVDRSFTIVGVIPAGFHGLLPGHTDDLLVPATTLPAMVKDRGSPWFESIARFAPGVTPLQARSEVDTLFQAYMREHPASPENRRDTFHHMEVISAARGLSDLRERFSAPLQALMGVVALVLLIACANITNLLLARAQQRQREFAVRVAIGAGRGRLAHQLFVETATLFLAGAAAGAVLAVWCIRGLTSFLAGGAHPVKLDIHWDWRILGFTALVSILATLVSGAAPVLRALRTDPHGVMKGGVRASRENSVSGRLLVAFQIALSLVLLVGAALLLRTVGNLHAVDAGFRTDHVALVSTQLMESAYSQQASRIAAWARMLAAVRSLPGVRSASLAAMTPLDGGGRRVGLSAPGFRPRSESDRFVSLNTVSEDYFVTLGTPLLRGRAFSELDHAGAPKVAMLNESAARHYFGDRDPVGAIVNINERASTIVGVVQDVRQTDVRQTAGRFVYVPVRQPYDRNFGLTLAVRTAVDPESILGAVQRRIRSVGSDLLIRHTQTLEQQVAQSFLAERLLSWLATAFGILALLLSAVGLYGVMAYSVARRTPEIGIRLALGAQPARVAENILRQTVSIVAIGLVVGIPASILVTSAAAKLLYGVTPTDVATQAGAATVLATVALVASYVPSRRAGRIDPLAALRHE